jgi:hypothetical protein
MVDVLNGGARLWSSGAKCCRTTARARGACRGVAAVRRRRAGDHTPARLGLAVRQAPSLRRSGRRLRHAVAAAVRRPRCPRARPRARARPRRADRRSCRVGDEARARPGGRVRRGTAGSPAARARPAARDPGQPRHQPQAVRGVLRALRRRRRGAQAAVLAEVGALSRAAEPAVSRGRPLSLHRARALDAVRDPGAQGRGRRPQLDDP